MRKVIHLDMDCFFAAVELRDRPELRGRPIAVAGEGRRSVLSTCNYEARAYGLRSAMPLFMARRLCPGLVVLPHRMDRYGEVSRVVRSVLLEYSDLVEPLGLDEAFVDVSHLRDRRAWQLASEIRSRIFEQSGLTSSAGVSVNKMLAKIASDWRKPNGQFAVLPEDVDAFMKVLPVRRIWGVGEKTAARLESMGVKTCGDLQGWSRERLQSVFGPHAEILHERCRGVDDRPVEVNRERKSMSAEETFEEDCCQFAVLEEKMRAMAEDLDRHRLASRHRDRGIQGLFVKLKFSDFRVVTRSVPERLLSTKCLYALLEKAWQAGSGKGVRLLGVGMRFVSAEPGGHLLAGTTQMSLPLSF
jgi:DNA polymerase-4